MYLKKLELHGFKSFPNKTVLTFERGATVIVGPNGSGKSNISDAMRWVLGELSSRNIRAAKKEDVIFGGTDGRKQMNFAEVSVTFDNTDPENRLDTDFDEVTITRRLFRSGDTEYSVIREFFTGSALVAVSLDAGWISVLLGFFATGTASAGTLSQIFARGAKAEFNSS